MCGRAPSTAVRLTNDGGKGHAFGLTGGLGTKVGTFHVSICTDCTCAIDSGPSHDVFAKAARDGKVERSRASAAPSREIHIRMASASSVIWSRPILLDRTAKWSGLEQTWAFQFGIEAGAGTEEVNLIPKQVMPFCPVAPARTNQAVIPKTVNNAVAEGAVKLRIIYRNPQMPLHHGFEQQRLDVGT